MVHSWDKIQNLEFWIYVFFHRWFLVLSRNFLNCSKVWKLMSYWLTKLFFSSLSCDKIETNSRVFLLRQIWIVNYCVKNPIKKSQIWKQKNWCFQKNSLFWHFNSRFVLKTTETPVFMFSLLRYFDVIVNDPYLTL